MPLVEVFVTLKPTVLDAQGQTVQQALANLGGTNVEAVRVGKYIVLDLADGPNLEAQVHEMCDKLLANPVMEDYRFVVRDE